MPQVDHAPFCSKEFDCLVRGGVELLQVKIVKHVSGGQMEVGFKLHVQ
jgi:hypothetical protein